MVIREGHLIPLVAIERVHGHQLGVNLEDLPVVERSKQLAVSKIKAGLLTLENEKPEGYYL